MAYFAYFAYFGIFCILFILVYFTARIEDGDQIDVMLQITGQAIVCPSEQTAGTKVSPVQIPSRQVAILQAFESTLGPTLHYTLSVWRWQSQPGLPCFKMGNNSAWQCWDKSYTSLDLPAIPLDRSDISVRCILRPDQVQI